MKPEKLICGIDISKDSLDVCYNKKKKLLRAKYKNNSEGHVTLINTVGREYTYVMENTGVYGLKLCHALKKSGADIRVENPLIIKRYIQMHMERNKSDVKDARWVCLYGMEREAKMWHLPTKLNTYCTQILSSIDFYKRQQTMLRNYLKALELYPVISADVKRCCEKSLSTIKTDIEKMEIKLDKYLSKKYGVIKNNLASIPGLGQRCVAYLIVLTDGFKRFENYRQVIAFAGLAPKEYSSGTMEVKKKICKMGNANLRKTLYMCSLSAIRSNKACKDLYNRLKEKGKKGRPSLIAVCNKLIKQAFAIAKSGRAYNATFVSTMPMQENVGIKKM